MTGLLKTLALAAVLGLAGGSSAGPIVSTKTNDTALIQRAIDAAASLSPAGTVELGSGVFRISSQLMVTNGVTLRGQGMNRTVIRQDVILGRPETRCVTLDGGSRLVELTLSGGRCADDGGGALVKDGTIFRCCISNCMTTVEGVAGGGVSFTGGRGSIVRSVITANDVFRGGWGGGVGGRATVGPVTIDTCLVSDNTCSAGPGGGVGFDGAGEAVTVFCSTIARNSGNFETGGLFFGGEGGGRLVLINSIFAANTLNIAEGNVRIAAGRIDGTRSNHCLFGLASEAESSGVSGSQYGFPSFADVVNRDYHLRGATELGYTDESGTLVDLDGVSRSGPLDVGCYEKPSTLTSAILSLIETDKQGE